MGVEMKLLFYSGYLLSLNLCRRGFQDLLKVRPSSLSILFNSFPD
jgi:hypothetical protein